MMVSIFPEDTNTPVGLYCLEIMMTPEKPLTLWYQLTGTSNMTDSKMMMWDRSSNDKWNGR